MEISFSDWLQWNFSECLNPDIIYIYPNRKELDCFAFKIKDVLVEGNVIFSIDALHAPYITYVYIYI